MARRLLSLAIRIAVLALLLLGPMLLVLTAVLVVPEMPERLAGTLVMVSSIWFFSALLLAPAVIFRDSGSSPGADDDGGGNGGSGPPREPRPPAPPRGGIPLPDAEPARVRLRDHARPPLRQLRPRRPAREPDPTPAPTPDR